MNVLSRTKGSTGNADERVYRQISCSEGTVLVTKDWYMSTIDQGTRGKPLETIEKQFRVQTCIIAA